MYYQYTQMGSSVTLEEEEEGIKKLMIRKWSSRLRPTIRIKCRLGVRMINKPVVRVGHGWVRRELRNGDNVTLVIGRNQYWIKITADEDRI